MEPIPGYKLIERLGGGGFGEVWKAEAPGGILKAIKFVHGTLHSATDSDDSSAVQQELKSLNRVKSVRHPYILSLERYDIIDGQLMIVMELADRNLWDRFKESQGQGQIGIPREELLNYMEEAAEALDLMNIQYGLQHLDIKPQNLFLVYNHCKVADFGLVKDLEGMNTQVTGGVTPVYAAPETFDGVITRYCDQYNLAIVYQELLTGERPFNGTNLRQLLMQHLTAAPELKSLPASDRPIVARALSKKPEDRYPSCSDMVQELRQAALRAAPLQADSRPIALIPRPEAPPPTPVPAPEPVELPPPLEAQDTPVPVKAASPPLAPPTRQPPSAQAEKKPAAQPPSSPATVKKPQPLPSSFQGEKKPAVIAEPPPRPQRQEITGPGVLVPALVIGVGGIGLRVLKQLRQALHERCGPPPVIPHIQLLYVETDPDAARAAFIGRPEAVLQEEEIVLARLNKPSHYLRPARGRIAIENWLNMNMLCRVPRNQVTADGLRILGRLAFADNYRAILTKLKTDLAEIASPQTLTAADRHTRLGVRTSRPQVWVVTSLGGGSGSGMFIDLAYVVRRQLDQLGVLDPEVNGLFLLPSADRNARKSPALVNAFAALTELHHFSSPKTAYSAAFDEGEDGFLERAAPFKRCVMAALPEEALDPGPTEDALARASDYLCRDLLSPLGRSTATARAEHPAEGQETACQTFGSYVFASPRRLLLERVSGGLVGRMVHGWLTAERTLVKAVRLRLTERLRQLELEPEHLIASLQAACQHSLRQEPEVIFHQRIEQHYGAGGTEDPTRALKARTALEEIIGQPQEEDDPEPARSPLSDALDAAARELRKKWEQKLLDLVRSLVDDPRFRVVGAEEAGLQITTLLEEVVEHQQTLLQELLERAGTAYEAIDDLTTNLRKGSWWPGRTGRMADELRNALEEYPKARYQGMVLESLLEVYGKLLKRLPQHLEEVTFSRQRLTDWQRALDKHGPDGVAPARLSPGRHFLPGNCQTVDEAVDLLLGGVTADDVRQFDAQVQELIRSKFKSLPAVCLSTDDIWYDFQRQVRALAEAQLNDRLGEASAAAAYLEQHGGEGDLQTDLQAALQEAEPLLPGKRYGGPELCQVLVPADAAGDALGQEVQAIVHDAEVIAVPNGSDVYFYRERPNVPLGELPQLGLLAEEVYKQMTAGGQFTPHTRTDIGEWLPAS